MKIRSLFILCASTMMIFISCGKNELTSTKKTDSQASAASTEEVANIQNTIGCDTRANHESKGMLVVPKPYQSLSTVYVQPSQKRRYEWHACNDQEKCMILGTLDYDYNTHQYSFKSFQINRFKFFSQEPTLTQSNPQEMTIRLNSNTSAIQSYKDFRLVVKDESNRALSCQIAVDMSRFRFY